MTEKNTLGRIYFGFLGVLTVLAGLKYLLCAFSEEWVWKDVMMAPGGIFGGGWGGLILVFAGLFYLVGLKNLGEVHSFSKVVMGSLLVWIVAGFDLFAMITESIPGGEEGGWFNTAEGFFNTYAPPYSLAIFLLPFSLVVIYYIRKRKEGQ